MRVRLLGAVEMSGRGHVVAVDRRQEQIVLAVLALRAGEVVPQSRLIDAVWGDDLPSSAETSLRAVVSRLRRRLAPTGTAVEHRGTGYVVLAAPSEVDALEFERAVAVAASTEDPAERVRHYTAALEAWRGPLLGTEPDRSPLPGDARRLEEMWLAACESLVRAELHAGGAGDPASIGAFVTDHPYRETSWGSFIISLYRHGRQAEALGAYQRARRILVDDLGVEPGAELQSLERAVLEHDEGVLWRRPAARPTRPPAPITPLVGRESDVAAVLAALDGERLVTLSGLGGIGKTRLAVEVATQLGAGEGRRVAWAGLADVEAGRVVGVVREATGTAGWQAGEEHAGGTYARSWPVDVDVLVVDNCEHALEVVPAVVVGLLSENPGLRVLCTSREPLGVPGEVIRPVASLTWTSSQDEGPAGAVALLWQRARAANPRLVLDEATHAELLRICDAVDGVPLALELAAARLATASAASVADDLVAGRGLVRSMNRGSDRHASMAAALDSTFGHLPEAAQHLLGELAVFRGGFVRDAVAAVCTAGPDGLGSLDELVVRSWVGFTPDRGGRYRMLEPVRQYAAAFVTEESARVMSERHAAWAARFAEEAGRGVRTDQRAWALRIDEEQPNLAAAVDWSLGREGDTCALRILAALGVAWSQQGGPEPLSWAEAALAQGRYAPDRLLAKALLGAGAVARNSLARSQAATWIDQAMAIYRKSGRGPGLAYAVLERAMCAMADAVGDYGLARALFEEGLELFEALGDPVGIGWCLHNLGYILSREGNDGAALPYYERAVDLAERAEVPHVVGAGVRELGRMTYERGDHGTGRALMERAVEIYRLQGDRWQLGNAMAMYGMTIRADDPRGALALFAETLRLGEATRLADHVIHAALGIAWLAHEHGLTPVVVDVAAVVLEPAEQARVRLLEAEDWLGQLRRLTVGCRQPATLDGIARVAWRALGQLEATLDSGPVREDGRTPA